MFYLPRLFVYHAEAKPGSEVSETFKVMEARLLDIIMRPAIIAVWLSGLALAYWAGFWTDGWFHAKFALVLVMSGIHGYLAVCVRAFAEEKNTRSSRFYRMLNEAPTLLMVLIVLLVIVKPF